MRRIRCPRLAMILGVALVQLSTHSGRAQDVEGRPSARASEEVRRRDEQRRSETDRRVDDREVREKRVTRVEEVAKEIDLTKKYNSGEVDFNKLAEKIKADEALRKKEEIDLGIARKSDAKAKVDITLERIARGEKDPHRHDGTEYKNRDGRLPQRESGYYREYVYRPEGQENTGLERVIVGRGGDVYYTPDHYETFEKVK